MDAIEKTGKTVEDALALALSELKATLVDVELEVLDHGSRGFFGLGSKPARVSVKLKFDPVRTAREFLEKVCNAIGLKVDIIISMKENKKEMNINIKGADIGVLIGKRGQTLDSLQYLVNLVVNKGNMPYIGILLDTENYRQRRRETLESLAVNLSKKAKATRKNVVLEPMSSYERRIIHATLQGNKFVTTYSEGHEPFRYVVISPKTGSSEKQSHN